MTGLGEREGDAGVLGALLAGGQSRRFGSDKARADWQGRPLLHWAAAALPGAERLILAPPGKYTAELPGWPVRPDGRPGCGPLGGLETALAYGAERDLAWVALAGVDQPALTPDYWGALLARRGETGVRCVKALAPDGEPQPLGALYHVSLLGRVRGLLDSGQTRLRLAAAPEETALVPGLPARCFANVNTPGELRALGESGKGP